MRHANVTTESIRACEEILKALADGAPDSTLARKLSDAAKLVFEIRVERERAELNEKYFYVDEDKLIKQARDILGPHFRGGIVD